MVLKAISYHTYNLNFASDNLKNDREFILKVLTQHACSLEYISDELKNDKEIVKSALQKNKNDFIWAHDDLKNDIEMLTFYLHKFSMNNSDDSKFYKECKIKLKLLKEQKWLNKNAPKATNIKNSKIIKF